MSNRWLIRCGYLWAALLFASGLAHAGLGWPGLRQQLLQAGVPPTADVLGATGAGWLFGSICMFTFAFVFAAVTRSLERGESDRSALQITRGIGGSYMLFGSGGLIGRGLSSHFIAFIVLGALFVIWSGSMRRLRRSRDDA